MHRVSRGLPVLGCHWAGVAPNTPGPFSPNLSSHPGSPSSLKSLPTCVKSSWVSEASSRRIFFGSAVDLGWSSSPPLFQGSSAAVAAAKSAFPCGED